MDLNKAMMIGRLTRDPEIRTTPSGHTVASFAIATNLVWTDQTGQKQERPEYHNIVAWRRLAEICGQYLRKGSKIYIEGRLQTRDWMGQDNVKRYRTEIVADNMIMLDRAGTAGGNMAPREESPLPQEMPEKIIDSNEPAGREEGVSEEEIKVENIPF
ncbi:single-stranded DNA-binding protein [Candidatus Falkowbacteria bacterium]|nr:MAG: single-stranded DNA-binding protein [Candidatus Falkowbacteria bacterium]